MKHIQTLTAFVQKYFHLPEWVHALYCKSSTCKYICVFILFILGISCSYRPTFSPSELAANVDILDTRNTIEFRPSSQPISSTGLLFYPGGLVDNHVYDVLLSRFAAEGYLVVVVKMPGNLAVFDSDEGISVIEEYPEVDTWVIAGHSLGGAMAAASVNENRTVYKGLILMDSYPPDSDDLSNWTGVVLCLFSSIEKISDEERLNKTLNLIPPGTWLDASSRTYPAATSNYTVLHQIDGGSHSYFGSYGPQDGDFTPYISEYDFHSEVLEYMIEFFTHNGWNRNE